MKAKVITIGTIVFILCSLIFTSFFCWRQSFSIRLFDALSNSICSYADFSAYLVTEMVAAAFGIVAGIATYDVIRGKNK